MTVFDRRPLLRWLVPLLSAVVLAAGGAAVGVITAAARGGLPDRTAAQLLVDVQRARLDGLSGTIVENANLGLPSVPGTGGSGSSDMTSLVTGSHTLRLWYAGPRHVRLSLLGSLGESDLVRSGTSLWTWSSATKRATHYTVPGDRGDLPSSLSSASPVTPQQAARAALKALTPTTKVSTDGTAMVAGRPAYELLLQPRDPRTLVGSVRIAVDGRTHLPMRVQVFSRHGGSPAFEVGFTSFDPTAPGPSVFRFRPPPGTKVTHSSVRAHASTSEERGRRSHQVPGAAPTVVGKSWRQVVVAKVPTGAASASGPTSLTRVLQALPTVRGSWGSGHLLKGSLFSAVLTNDGRVAIGAVPPDAVYAALARR